MQVRYSTSDASWLCFKHAVQRAIKDEDVATEIDDFNSDEYMGTTVCVDCVRDYEMER